MQSGYVALLRGINVGGKNMLPMKALVAIFEAAGCKDVRTYIQSGNVIFNASRKVAESVPAKVPAAILKQFGLSVPVVLRTAAELASTMRTNPYLAMGVEAERCFVMFLAHAPHPDHIAGLDLERGKPDLYQVIGREVYMHMASGVGNTKLTNAYFDSRLKTVSTGRNLRTVTKLLDMLGSVS